MDFKLAMEMVMVTIDGKIDEASSPGGEATRMTMVMMVTIDCNLICPATLPHSVQTISSLSPPNLSLGRTIVNMDGSFMTHHHPECVAVCKKWHELS